MARVLVARTDNIGDVLLTGPAVRAVAAAGEEVTFLAGPRGAGGAQLLPGVSDVLVHHTAWIDAQPRPVERHETTAFVDMLADREFERALIFTSFHQSPLPLALLLRMAAVPFIAAISIDYPGSLLDVRHRVDDGIHEVERAVSLADAAGYRLPAGDDGRLALRRDVAGRSPVPGSYVVVHPGASVPARAWSPARNAEAIRALCAAGHAVVVTGGPDERALTAAVVADADASGVIDLGGRTDLAGLASVLAGARAVVVGNTGAAHLAAAVGTPVVSLFAPTVPAARWRPWGVPHVLLGDQTIACAGCRARSCPIEGHPCLSGVTAGDVVAAVERVSVPALVTAGADS
jgi:ADP-heptose:LPS heptosyltransferase